MTKMSATRKTTRTQLALVHPPGDGDQQETERIQNSGHVAKPIIASRTEPGISGIEKDPVFGPYGLWMSQIARNLTDSEGGILIGKRYLIHDRDPLFTAEFLSMITETGVESVKLPPRSPNLNAYAERLCAASRSHA